MISSLTLIALIADMPPRKAPAARRGRPSVARRGRGVVQDRGQTEPAMATSTAESVTPPTPGVRTSEPPPPQPAMEIRELRETVQMLAQIVAQQAQRQEADRQTAGRQEAEGSQPVRRESSQIRDFLACEPPEFFGTRPADDPQEFIRQMQRTLRVIGASETASVELASYRLRGVAANWFESWRLSRGVGAGLARWDEFSEAFLAHFLPPETRRAREDRFLSLRQRGRSIQEYSMEFDTLALYAPAQVARMADRVHRYISGLDSYYEDGCMLLAAQPGMDIARVQAYAQGMEDRRRRRQGGRIDDGNQPKRARSSGHLGGFQDRPPQQQLSIRPPQQAQSVPQWFPDGSSGATDQIEMGPRSGVAGSQLSRGSGSAMRPPRPPCPYCGVRHRGECRHVTGACFACGGQDHQVRDCPARSGTSRFSQPTGSADVSSSASVAMRPIGRGASVSTGRGRGREGTSGSGGPINRIYALTSRQVQEVPPHDIPGTLFDYL